MSLCYNCQGLAQGRNLHKPRRIFHTWQDCMIVLNEMGYKVLKQWDGSKCDNCGAKMGDTWK